MDIEAPRLKNDQLTSCVKVCWNRNCYVNGRFERIKTTSKLFPSAKLDVPLETFGPSKNTLVQSTMQWEKMAVKSFLLVFKFTRRKYFLGLIVIQSTYCQWAEQSEACCEVVLQQSSTGTADDSNDTRAQCNISRDRLETTESRRYSPRTSRIPSIVLGIVAMEVVFELEEATNHHELIWLTNKRYSRRTYHVSYRMKATQYTPQTAIAEVIATRVRVSYS